LAIVALLLLEPAGADEVLNIGDPAPPLSVSEWAKGEKIDKLQPNETYVVEFWAPWCLACRQTIPHLTELAHHYKSEGVHFIGVNVWQHDTKRVQPFVDEMGDKMGYAVALDAVPDGSPPDDGAMAKGWMVAADEHGIPTAFVIQDGKIAWIGYPSELDEPLAKIVSRQWDITAAIKQRLARKALDRKEKAAQDKIDPVLFVAKNYKDAILLIDEAISNDPELAPRLAPLKFIAVCNSGDTERGLALGRKLLAENMDNEDVLFKFHCVVAPDRVDNVDPRVAALALKAARRGVELTNEENPNYLDNLADELFRTGDAAGAAANLEKVIKVLKKLGTLDEKLVPFNERLDLYRKAMNKK